MKINFKLISIRIERLYKTIEKKKNGVHIKLQTKFRFQLTIVYDTPKHYTNWFEIPITGFWFPITFK